MLEQNIFHTKNEVDELTAQIFFFEKEMKEDKEKMSNLIEKRKLLETRESDLAKLVLKRIKCEIDWVSKKIIEQEELLEKLYAEKEEKQRKLSEMEGDFSSYVEEQTTILISAFLGYIKNHLEDIGTEMVKTFTVREITDRKSERIGIDYEVPTGNVGVYDENKCCFVATTLVGENYFKAQLYELHRYSYDHMGCQYTEWYKGYLKSFIDQFMEALQKEYCFADSLKLTINTPHFTLELV